MSRRTTLGALVMALLLISSAPAAAKGPTRLEIQYEQGGTPTVLTDSQNEFFQLMELVGWPEGRSEPPGLDSGALEHVATLTWTFDDKTPLWIDRVYANGAGETWVQRRDIHGGGGAVTWGQLRGGKDLTGLLGADEPTTSSLQAPVAAAPELDAGEVASAAADDALPSWSVGLLALLVVGPALAIGWRRTSARKLNDR